jgi:hypothetical protein
MRIRILIRIRARNPRRLRAIPSIPAGMADPQKSSCGAIANSYITGVRDCHTTARDL